MSESEEKYHESAGEQSGEQRLEGTLERISWSSADGSFVVARFNVEGELFPIVAVGAMHSASSGERYALTGSWDVHPKYGRQFRFTGYEIVYPNTNEGVVRYLGSGLIRGIRESLATKIVRHFGADTMHVMNEQIDRLLEIEGIGPSKLAMIRDSWNKQRGVQNVMLFLKEHGVSTAFAVKIFHAYGARAVEILSEDPYRMVEDIEGIGFVTADGIARGLGIAADDVRRLTAGVAFVLREASMRDGHSCVPEQEFVRHAATLLGGDEGQVHGALRSACERGLVRLDGGYAYLPVLHDAEQGIADALAQSYGEHWNGVDHGAVDAMLRHIESDRGLEFNAQQVEAIHLALTGPVCILTGGPGTGKTTTLIGVLDCARQLGLRLAVCAPTGRAAKRITEVTGTEAKTIHRLLEYDPHAMEFQRDSSRPIEADLLVVDEMSMVDVLLFSSLLRARPRGCRVLLVGDADQLPSVGPGTVLRDLIATEEVPTVILRLVFRQAANSTIITNAHRVREGFAPVFDTRLHGGGETFLRETGPDEHIPELVRELVAERIPREFGCDPLRDIQVLAPMYNTAAGVTNLNHVLQRALNGGSRVLLQRGDRAFRRGDKVMHIRNDYEKDVYNGDIGFVESFDEEEQKLYVNYDANRVGYTSEETDDLVLAYAVTIHKSQGSEYGYVVVPMTMQHRIMLRRTLLYTAMTRAKRLLVLIGERVAVSTAVSTATEKRRHGLLRDRVVAALR